MTNHERAGHVVNAEVAALKMAWPECPEQALKDLFLIIVEAALDAVSRAALPPSAPPQETKP